MAAGCDHKDNNLFLWPDDPALIKQLNAFVKTKRAKWKKTENSVLCIKYFENEYFLNLGKFNTGFAKRLAILMLKGRLRLKCEARSRASIKCQEMSS